MVPVLLPPKVAIGAGTGFTLNSIGENVVPLPDSSVTETITWTFCPTVVGLTAQLPLKFSPLEFFTFWVVTVPLTTLTFNFSGLTPGTDTSIGFRIPLYITFIAVGETTTLGSPTKYDASKG